MGDLFGSSDKSSQKAQIKANAGAQDFITQQGDLARNDILSLFPYSNFMRNAGYQQALDVYGQTIPQQLNTFQRGNENAQGTLLAGLPQMNNAILGLPTDLNGLQVRSVPYDASYASQTIPYFSSQQSQIPNQPVNAEIQGGAPPAINGGAEAPVFGSANAGSGPGGGFEGGSRGAPDVNPGFGSGFGTIGPGGGQPGWNGQVQPGPIPFNSVGQNLADHGGLIGALLGGALGIPGGKRLGNLAGDQYYNQNFGRFYSPLPGNTSWSDAPVNNGSINDILNAITASQQIEGGPQSRSSGARAGGGSRFMGQTTGSRAGSTGLGGRFDLDKIFNKFKLDA